MTEKIIREIYYFDKNDLFKTYSQIDYTKINDTTKNVGSFFQNGQVKLRKEDGSYGGLYYGNKNIHTNNDTNIINSTNVLTISNDIGKLCYMLPFNSENLIIGDNFYTKPIYTSGGYLNKDILINQQVLNNKEETRKITIFY
jgi:hypothetical protein